MIKLTRAVPPPSRFSGEKRIEKNLDLIELQRAGKKPKRHVWKPAKEYLKGESHGKCAYCESATSAVAHGDVEHFRPKSVYWWPAYCSDNFSYSCQICNQSYKNAAFRIANVDRRWRAPRIPDPPDGPALRELARTMTPDPIERATGGMAFDYFARESRKEKPYLVDPYLENPEELYKWEADSILKEVRIAARTKRVRAVRATIAAEDDLGLNREELRRRRWQTYEQLYALAHAADSLPANSPAKAECTAIIRKMMTADSDYAGMVRYFVRVEWELNV